ncbi:hypothetical protein [Ulvibacterium sp.]|uniref:hypothetical protein n=1 Tax=Ulvibacterium sp. TaxID=2665914 RepID=UPI002623C707|nr:hypothetical protein [Ulvibacterium sp.]
MKNLRLTLSLLILGICGANLSAQEITSFSGMWGEKFYQDKEPLTWKEIDAIMKENQASALHWQKSKKNMVGALIAGTANFGSAIWLISNLDDNEPLTGPIIAVAGTGIISSIFFHSATKNKKMAILEYNDSLGKKTSLYLTPTSNENGVGLALKF